MANEQEDKPPALFDLAPHVLQAPLDADGFVVAHPPVDLPAIRAFFQTYGFVVIRDAVPEEARAGLQAAVLQRVSKGLAVQTTPTGGVTAYASDLDNIDWSSVYYSSYNTKYGFLGFDAAVEQAAFDVRQYPPLVAVFAALFGERELWCKIDRFGIMRPTEGIAQSASDPDVRVDRPAWKTASGFVHWDQNPWLEPAPCRIQGIVAITPHTATSGGFHCIPGFHRVYNAYADAYAASKTTHDLANLPNQDDKAYVQRITMRAGSMVLWDSRLPHGNWPNSDGTFRMVLYHALFVPPADPAVHVRFATNMAAWLDTCVPPPLLTPLGRRLLLGKQRHKVSASMAAAANAVSSSVKTLWSWVRGGDHPEHSSVDSPPTPGATDGAEVVGDDDVKQAQTIAALIDDTVTWPWAPVFPFDHNSLYNLRQGGLFLR